MGQVGAVFALEVSRLARSNLDWHRLLELCALTDTLVIDEDGCYNPADFNDGLLLGLKGTMAQAELHLLRGRLLGGKLNKARKGELRFRPLYRQWRCLPLLSVHMVKARGTGNQMLFELPLRLT
jgi:DNA invertase Pin-like site-specific DNA recombinase